MKIEVIVFDLDDTLYDEINYVKSGFKIVSEIFTDKYGLEKSVFYDEMLKELYKNGRGKVFDNVFKKFNIYSKGNVKKALSLYRSHNPNIKLRNDSKKVLNYFYGLGYPLYLVTDGNKIVQDKKIKALEIKKYFKKIFITHRYGIKNAKPSTFCFEKISILENQDFNKIVYIGDNINKDFINIKKLGFYTIRLKNGMFRDLNKSKKYEANLKIESLNELKDII